MVIRTGRVPNLTNSEVTSLDLGPRSWNAIYHPFYPFFAVFHVFCHVYHLDHACWACFGDIFVANKYIKESNIANTHRWHDNSGKTHANQHEIVNWMVSRCLRIAPWCVMTRISFILQFPIGLHVFCHYYHSNCACSQFCFLLYMCLLQICRRNMANTHGRHDERGKIRTTQQKKGKMDDEARS